MDCVCPMGERNIPFPLQLGRAVTSMGYLHSLTIVISVGKSECLGGNKELFIGRRMFFSTWEHSRAAENFGGFLTMGCLPLCAPIHPYGCSDMDRDANTGNKHRSVPYCTCNLF